MSVLTLKKSMCLKSSTEIGLLFKKGSYFKGRLLWVIVHKHNQKSGLKAAFLVKKKLGRKAVLRNKTKRWLREIFRVNRKCFPETVNLVVMPVKSYDSLRFQDLYEDFIRITKDQKFITFIS